MTTAPAITIGPQREREVEKKPLDLGILARLYRYTRPYAALRNGLFIAVIVRAVQIPVLAWLFASTVNDIINHASRDVVLYGTLKFLAFSLFTIATFRYRQKWGLQLGENVVHDLRREIFEHLQKMPMSFFNTTKLGRIISRMTSDAESVRMGVQSVFFVTLVAAGQMFVAALLMLWTDVVLFLVVALLSPILWCINQYFRGRYSAAFRAVQESFSRVTATLAESVNGIRVTQGFVRQEVNAEAFAALVQDHSAYNYTAARLDGIFTPLLALNSRFFFAALLVIGGYRVLDPDIAAPVDHLVLFFFLASVFFAPINSLGKVYTQALSTMAGAERLFRLLDTEPEWVDDPQAQPLETIRGRVEARNLSFAYVPGKPVLQDLNFVVEPGQTIAMVGHTGSGKTSIINLIAKFYLPTEGELLIDGIEIRNIQSDSLHRQMGIVLQVNFLFTGTVMDNIKVGKPDATDDEVIEAATRLGCLDLLESLPDGLYTQVGERGGTLSLGQRQLVCFTRAMLADPRILILDEATSAVDTMTEARIQQALATLLRGRTSLVVAHRLSTIRHADCVLVLDHGRLVERGTHNELLATAGVYANLYRQFIRSTEG